MKIQLSNKMRLTWSDLTEHAKDNEVIIQKLKHRTYEMWHESDSSIIHIVNTITEAVQSLHELVEINNDRE